MPLMNLVQSPCNIKGSGGFEILPVSKWPGSSRSLSYRRQRRESGVIREGTSVRCLPTKIIFGCYKAGSYPDLIDLVTKG
jgi:hypothetical protein